MTKGIKHHLDELRAICEEQLAQKSSHTWKEPGNKFDHGIRTAKRGKERTALGVRRFAVARNGVDHVLIGVQNDVHDER